MVHVNPADTDNESRIEQNINQQNRRIYQWKLRIRKTAKEWIIFFGRLLLWETLKTDLKSENGYSAPNARKTDEVRLDALRGGQHDVAERNIEVTARTPSPQNFARWQTQAVCYTHFNSNKVFRGDLMIICLTYGDLLLIIQTVSNLSQSFSNALFSNREM